jgi:hypothetical protein
MKYASVLLAIICLLSAVKAQWLETTIYLPDSFGGLVYPRCLTYGHVPCLVEIGSGPHITLGSLPCFVNLCL